MSRLKSNFLKLGSPDIPTRSFSPLPFATGHSQPAPFPKEEGLSSLQGPDRQPTPSRQQDGGRKMDVFVMNDNVMQLWTVVVDDGSL